MSSSEIVLVNLTAPDGRCAQQLYTAPLGLFCLAALADDKITVVDKKVRLAEETEAVITENTKAVIALLPSKLDFDYVKDFCNVLKRKNPRINLGLSSYVEGFEEFADFFDLGTGKSSILRILRGEVLKGVISSTDQISVLSESFSHQFCDNGYEIHPEKLISAKTIEIFKPWLGLQERNENIKILPGKEWFNGFIHWLAQAEFTGFHFSPAGFTCEAVGFIDEAVRKEGFKFAVSYDEQDTPELGSVFPSLKQIWFYCFHDISRLTDLVRATGKMGSEPCLTVDEKFVSEGAGPVLIPIISRVTAVDEEDWNPALLKQIIRKYWFGSFRLPKRLFSLRHASELVALLKSIYKMMDVLMGR